MMIEITSFTTPITSAILTPVPKTNNSGSKDTQNFTTTGIGSVINKTAKSFALQVKGTPAAADSWIVDLEGSLDGINFDAILTHSTGTGDGKIEFSGSMNFPVIAYRFNIRGFSPGAADSINVTVTGSP